MLDKRDLEMIKGMMVEVIQPLQEDISILKEDVSGLKEDVSGLKKDVSILKEDVSTLKDEVQGIKLHLENVTDRNIKILAENHGYLIKKFNESVDAAHNNHINTIQTSYLLEHMANLENRVQILEKERA